MPLSLDDTQKLCTKTEWNTLVNTFPPKVKELKASVAKKQANRVTKFLNIEEAGDGDKKRIAAFKEALERLAEMLPAKSDNDKKAARRAKEKKAKERIQQEKAKRTKVRERLVEKAEKEKAEAEGKTGDEEETEKKVKVRTLPTLSRF